MNGKNTRVLHIYEHETIEESIHGELRIPYEWLDEMYAEFKGRPVNLKETTWYNRIREGDTILLNQTLRGGNQKHQ